jgi:curved DNA-binding protein CbpA/CheY-like chemotaxis protein
MAVKIVIADRKNYFRDSMAKVLQERGFEVLVAENDKQLYEIINQKELPGLIFLNVLLPSKGGYELCKDIKTKEYWSKIRVILMGEVLVSVKLRQQATGTFKADDCMVIPSQLTDIFSLIKKQLQGEGGRGKTSSGPIPDPKKIEPVQEPPAPPATPAPSTAGLNNEPTASGDDLAKRVSERKERSRQQRGEQRSTPEPVEVPPARPSSPIPQGKAAPEMPRSEPIGPTPANRGKPAPGSEIPTPPSRGTKTTGPVSTPPPATEIPPDTRSAPTTIDFLGNLRDVPFCKVLGFIWRRQLTGMVKIERGPLLKTIYFRKGSPVGVDSKVSSESLGRFLVTNGIIAEKIHWQAVQTMIGSGRKLGDILISKNEISTHDLFKTLQFQVEEQILLPFGLDSGNYFINLVDTLPEKEIDHDLPAPQIIFRGIRRFYSLEQLTAMFAKPDTLVIMPGSHERRELIEKFLKPAERKLLRDISKNYTLSHLASLSKLDRSDLLSLLWTLLCLEAIYINNAQGLWLAAVDEYEEEYSWKEEPAPADDLKYQSMRHYIHMVKNDYATIMQSNPVNLFMLHEVFDEMELKTAYYSLTNKYRSDKNFHLAPKRIQSLADKIFKRLTETYELLYTELKRSGKDRFYIKDLSCSQTISTESLLKAELHYIKGVALIKMRSYDKAFDSFVEAAKLNPHEGEYYAYQGWCLYKKEADSQGNFDKAIDLIQKALEINPLLEYGHLFLGKIYKVLKKNEATEQFRLALQVNPDCAEAENELKWLRMQSDKADRKRQLDPKDQEMVNRIEDLYKRLPDLNYFELLQVEADTPQDIVRKSYFNLVKQYHPDKIVDMVDEDVTVMSQEIFTAFTEAYDVLSNTKKRRNYERAILPKQGDSDEDDENIRSRRLFENGKRMIARKNFEKALEFLSESLQMSPKNPVYNAYYGYCLYFYDGDASSTLASRMEKSFQYMNTAIELDHESYRPYLFLARIYKQENQLDKALQYFIKASECNDKCYEAVYEVKMLGLLKQGQGKSTLKNYIDGKY